ncbi:hypothetical protein [Sphingomonas morindae]|uniref:Uncharacterized protein n=1 Tax=Sphingomonas morindae TaxID=1541170 RepID=A0ABY4XB70_9SPHN|nr:hypothetical protein [Sphingomonas morindae]USI74191.1 hypothetical protein LHA26_06995 [Sphingomonas morindae]
MRFSKTVALAGSAALLAGLGVAATAERPADHLLRVLLPDGSVRQIRYSGDAPPRLVMLAPVAPDPLDAIAALMADEAEAMSAQMAALHQAALAGMAATPAAPGAPLSLTGATAGALPAGTGYSYVSTVTVNGKTCTTRIHSVAGAQGAAPQLLRQVSGDGCTAAAPSAPKPPVPPAPPATPRPPAPDTI